MNRGILSLKRYNLEEKVIGIRRQKQVQGVAILCRFYRVSAGCSIWIKIVFTDFQLP